VTRSRERLDGRTAVGFTRSQDLVDRSENRSVSIASVELMSNELNREALELRDKGRTVEARRKLDRNAALLEKKAKKYKSKRLKKLSKDNLDDSENLEGPAWNAQRKTMRKRQHELEMQQAW
jgi:hypothetical protein